MNIQITIYCLTENKFTISHIHVVKRNKYWHLKWLLTTLFKLLEALKYNIHIWLENEKGIHIIHIISYCTCYIAQYDILHIIILHDINKI